MVKIGGKPILWHIMQRYDDFNHKDFYIALGYKSEVVKEYFLKSFSSRLSEYSDPRINVISQEILSEKYVDAF